MFIIGSGSSLWPSLSVASVGCFFDLQNFLKMHKFHFHAPIGLFVCRQGSLLIKPGSQNYIGLTAFNIMSHGISTIKPADRGCLYADEMKLIFHKRYTQANCVLGMDSTKTFVSMKTKQFHLHTLPRIFNNFLLVPKKRFSINSAYLDITTTLLSTVFSLVQNLWHKIIDHNKDSQ